MPTISTQTDDAVDVIDCLNTEFDIVQTELDIVQTELDNVYNHNKCIHKKEFNKPGGVLDILNTSFNELNMDGWDSTKGMYLDPIDEVWVNIPRWDERCPWDVQSVPILIALIETAWGREKGINEYNIHRNRKW